MAGENQLSPLFGDMQATSQPGMSSVPANVIPDKTDTILGALNTSETLPELPETPTSPDVVVENTLFSADTHSNSQENPPQTVEKNSIEGSVSMTEKISPLVTPLEKIETTSPEVTAAQKEIPPDPKLAQYLQVDRVYQAMMHVENHERIRLGLAIRYTLLMFAIFLVFAWIVSNRIIMFGFSEFAWLARIRDGLFAVMAGLFSLTLWFGSVVWMRQALLIALFRTLAVVFFVAVIVALYLPLR